MTTSTLATTPCFKFKGSLFTLTTLQLFNTDLVEFEAQLTTKIKQAPQFFAKAPVVVELQTLNKAAPHLDIIHLIQIIRKHHLIPLGVRGNQKQHQQWAEQASLAYFATGKPTELPPETEATPKQQHSPAPVTSGKPGKIITHPIRSGQQIYAKGGDLIVMTSVSPGAEILADGHIHVYGPLRGRALAGVLGYTEAQIFCQHLEAELLSIAGQYLVSEQLKRNNWQQSVRIYLEGEQLHIDQL